MKPTVWIFSLEPIETRYTGQWLEHIPKLLSDKLGTEFNVRNVSGEQKCSTPTPGAFLNFSDTNYWKSSQLCKFLELVNDQEVRENDHILFTDAWNPVVLQVKYMSDLLNNNWTLHGLWHAGNYDPNDFLGRLGEVPWIEFSEKAMFHAYNHNYFATKFHANELFADRRLYKGYKTPETEEDLRRLYESRKIVITGWPMEYMEDIIFPGQKEDLILFPHRIAPEKQPEIFKDLEKALPQYKFVMCQESKLTKKEYHSLLSRAKIVFSANLQETLGISPYEGVLAGAIPVVPDRLSYQEMYLDEFKYPSEWTIDFNAYEKNKDKLINLIENIMTSYDKISLDNQKHALKEFFNADALIEEIRNANN